MADEQTVTIPLKAAQLLLLDRRLQCFQRSVVPGSPFWQATEWLEKSVSDATGQLPESWWKERA